MNAELSKIRKNKNLDELMSGEVVKIDPDLLLDKIYKLNINMTHLYNINNNPEAKIDEYVEKIISNIYLILDMFNDMGIYPDYFYDVIVKMNIEYRNLVTDGKIRGNYGLYQLVNFSAKISQLIKEGLLFGKHQIDPVNSKDIGECFVEMISFFQKYNMSYNNKSIEACQLAFKDIYYNVNNIINNTLNNSDFTFVDIECMARLLFEYISFFAAIGINPKPYLDEYIERESKNKKSK